MNAKLEFCPVSEPDHPEKPEKHGNFDFLNTRSSGGVFNIAG